MQQEPSRGRRGLPAWPWGVAVGVLVFVLLALANLSGERPRGWLDYLLVAGVAVISYVVVQAARNFWLRRR